MRWGEVCLWVVSTYLCFSLDGVVRKALAEDVPHKEKSG